MSKLSDDRVKEIMDWMTPSKPLPLTSIPREFEIIALCKEVLAAREMRDLLDCYSVVHGAINCEEDLSEAVKLYDAARNGE